MTSKADREGAMDSLDTWLAAMPVSDVDRRIAELERELEVMRVLKARHRERSRLTDPSPSRTMAVTPQPRTSGRALSPERAQIIEVMRGRPEGVSPNEVAQSLEKDPNPVQTTMSRMQRTGQIVRVAQGRYRLPPENPAASLLNGAASGEEA